MDDFNTEKARENNPLLRNTLPLQHTTLSPVIQQEKSFYTSNSQQNNSLEFEEAMRRDGFHFPGPLIPDGSFHRFPGKKKNKKDAFCVLNQYSGCYGDWLTREKYYWTVPMEGKTPWEIKKINQDIEKTRKTYEEETEKRNQEAAQEAEALWDNARDAGISDYLENKQVPAFNLKYNSDEYGDFVAVPLKDIEGKLWNIQKIYSKREDGGNHKWPIKGGRKKGCFHTLGTPLHELPEKSRIFVAEGYATAASIHMATGDTVIMAVDSGNIDPVVKAIKTKYPYILGIIAGDEDRWSEEDRNAGREKAEAAALKYGWPMVFPEFKEEHHHERPTDFNDLHHLEGLEVVQEQLISGDTLEIWPDPLPIRTELRRVKPFDYSLLPEPLATFVRDCALRMQCPPDYIAVAVIAMIGSLIGSSCAVKPKKYDDWIVSSNLYGGIIGEPSTLKTPAINEAFSPLHKLEKEAKQRYDDELKEWEAKNKITKTKEELVYAEIKKQMKNKSFSEADALKLYNQNKPQANPKPIRRRHKINDATVEKTHELLSENPRGLLSLQDELTKLLNSFLKQGHETDRSFYLEAWNGFLPITVDRIQRGTVETENTCLSVFGSTQPDKMKDYLYKTLYGNDNDGFLQRFQLLVYPDSPKKWEYVDQPPIQDAQEQYYKLASKIAAEDFLDSITDLQEIKGKKCFSFDDAAQQFFIKWLTEHETRLRQLEQSDEPIIIQHLAKYRKLMPALSSIFHHIYIATGGIKTGKITRESAVRAICWCEYLESHARRIYGMGLDISANAAAALVRKIESGALGVKFSLRKIYRKQWSFLKDNNSVEAACEELVNAHWLKEISTEPSQGNKIRTEYIVNPKVKIAKREEKDHE